MAVIALKPPTPTVSGPQKLAKDSSGVPVYLQRVKRAVVEEQRAVIEKLGLGRNSDGAPVGYRFLTDCERLEVLEGLERRQSELKEKHDKLPLSIQTEGQRRRANELEKALREVEDHIKQFSRPKIMVSEDAD